MAELSVRITTNVRDQKWKRQKAITIIELLYFNAALQSINDHSLTVTYNRKYE